MAAPLQLRLMLLLTTTTTIILVISTTVSAASSTTENASNSPLTPSDPQQQCRTSTCTTAFPSTSSLILANLGFNELASAAATSSFSTTTTAITIFAPTDSSLLTCHSCSVPLLLQEHTVPGIYSLQYLRKLAFGTKIVTLAPGPRRCITITSADNSTKMYVGGAEITHPDLFNDGTTLAVHGIQGFISHLSPLMSCQVERMTSLSFPPPHPMSDFLMMRIMLKDAMLRLRISGYSVLALALRFNYADIVNLRNATVFALDDAAILSSSSSSSYGEHMNNNYVSDLKFHIVPNRMLMAADLESLPEATILPTMEHGGGEKLVVTTAGGGGPLAPMRINYVKMKRLDMVHNLKIVVHGLWVPFRRHQTGFDLQQIQGSAEKVPAAGRIEFEEYSSSSSSSSVGPAPVPFPGGGPGLNQKMYY